MKYLVTFANKSTQTFDTVGDAQQAVRGVAGATFKAVRA